MSKQVGQLIVGTATALLCASGAAAKASANEVQPIIVLATAATPIEERELFVRETSPNVTQDARSYFSRLFAALLPPKRYASGKGATTIITGAIENRPFAVADADTSADPYYKKWEAEAQKRLKEENTVTGGKESPLAAQYPDSYITVCEAGCRSGTDKIVYKVAKAEAATAQPRGFVPSSAGSSEISSAQTADSRQPDQSDPNVIDCVAGCYDSRPKSYRAHPDRDGNPSSSRQRTGDARPDYAKERLASSPATDIRTPPHSAKSAALSGTANASRTSNLVREKMRAINDRIAVKAHWRTRLLRATPIKASSVQPSTEKADVTSAHRQALPRHWKIKIVRTAMTYRRARASH